MKKIKKSISLIAIIVLLMDPVNILAQGGLIELTPFSGYQFGGKLRFYEGEIKVNNNVNYGMAVDFAIAYETKIELLWTFMSTTAEFKPFYGFENLRTDPFKVNISYLQIGGVQEVGDGNIRPFGAFTLGATYFGPQTSGAKDSWRFSVTLGGGAKFWLTDGIGIRLQGRLLMPLYFQGANFYFGSGGSGVGVGAGSTILQGDLTAGLIIALGDH